MPHCFTHLTNCYCISIPRVLFLSHVARHVSTLPRKGLRGKVKRFLTNMKFSRWTRTLISPHLSMQSKRVAIFLLFFSADHHKSRNRIERVNLRRARFTYYWLISTEGARAWPTTKVFRRITNSLCNHESFPQQNFCIISYTWAWINVPSEDYATC